jgi:hypothetical protein
MVLDIFSFVMILWVLNFESHFEALNDVFWEIQRLGFEFDK